MLLFHAKRVVAGREDVGTNTCGSTFKSACSRSCIAYLAKSAEVAYGEVDWSSGLTAPTIAGMKQSAKSLFMCKLCKLPHPFIRSLAFRQGIFHVKKPALGLWIDHRLVRSTISSTLNPD